MGEWWHAAAAVENSFLNLPGAEALADGGQIGTSGAADARDTVAVLATAGVKEAAAPGEGVGAGRFGRPAGKGEQAQGADEEAKGGGGGASEGADHAYAGYFGESPFYRPRR
ncbi:MAG TPA: hypothetical protein VFW25_14750 [Silvibacterium sp.]|nr:hypothetical protein [Silvibacterium sp.]